MKIGIASDHRGYNLKRKLIEYLKNKNYEVIDYGTNSREPADYPVYAFKLGESIVKQDVEAGIAICGTGIGISIALNKVKGIMCAKVSTKKEASLAKEHNHANCIAISGDRSFFKAKDIINTYLTSTESTEEKHQRRINEIKKYESNNA